MPELPDLTVYLDALERNILGRELLGIRIANPFILRSVEPPVEALAGKRVVALRRIGKRLVIELDDSLFVVIHLMIAGRLRWQRPGARVPGKLGLMALDFENGTILLTEASQQRRASVHLVSGEDRLTAFNAGGVEVFDIDLEQFIAAMSRENHTLKRSLTDPRILAGIGNAYSDEILHRAGLSPMRQVRHLGPDEWRALYDACREVLQAWTRRLRDECGEEFPDKVTAFHPGMAVHGKYKQPCPECGKPVQRIRYASNECNYCAVCQNQGNLLADRSLSRLLKKDWPRTIEELDKL